MRTIGYIMAGLVLASCAAHYRPLGEPEVLRSEKGKPEYSMEVVEEPTPSSPELVLQVKARWQVEEECRQKLLKVRNKANFLWFPLIGTPIGITLSKSGRVVLGRDIIGLSALMALGYLAWPDKGTTVWKEFARERTEEGPVAGEKFTVELVGEDYALDYYTDDRGMLRVGMADFAPFYEEGKIFSFKVLSPEGEVLKELSVDTGPLGKFLARRKKFRFPPDLHISVSFSDEKGNHDYVLDAYEEGEVKLVVENRGKGMASDLEVRLVPLSDVQHLTFPEKRTISRILPGRKETVSIPIKADGGLGTGEVRLRVEVLEPYFGADAEPMVLRFRTREYVPPKLVLYDKAVEEGWIEPRKVANISLVVQNRGGPAYGVKARLSLPANVRFLGESQEWEFGDMGPGGWKRVDFPIYISPRYRGKDLELKLFLTDGRTGKTTSLDVSFPMKQRVTTPKEIAIKPLEEGRERYAPPPEVSVDVDMEIPATGLSNPDAVAVVVGVKDYSNPSIPPVEYALRDAEVFREYLVSTFGLSPENIIFLRNPTKAELESVFGTRESPRGRLYNYVKPGASDVFVFYSGHGAPDPETRTAYLVPYDADPNYIRINGYPLSLLYDNLSHIPARRKFVFLDACFSGTTEGGMLLRGISGIMVEPVEVGRIDERTVVFTAASGDEVATWYEEKKHGLFTYFFLKGLKGEADSNGDRRLTAGELAGYLKDEVPYMARRLRGREQHPEVKGNLEMVLLERRR